jgi:hypothetical protein
MSNGNSGQQFTGGNTQPINHRLRAPQNGPHMQGSNGPVPRSNNSNSNGMNQQQQRPMSQRLGPPNGHGPSNSNHHNNNNKPSTSFIKVLEDYFNQMGLGTPEFKTSKLEKKTSNAGGKSSKKGSISTKFYSTVRVNNQSFQVTVSK